MAIIIDNRSNDGAAISFMHRAMVGQINTMLCYFYQVGTVP